MKKPLITAITRAFASSLLVALLAGPAEGGVATVGTGAGCSHTDLASAVAAVEAGTGAPHAIFVVDENLPTFSDVTITESMTIWGGLPTCAGPSPTAGRPIMTDTDGGYAIRVAPPAGAGRIEVVLRFLEIRGTEGQESGGIEIIGNADVTLDFMDINNSSHTSGGGLRVAGDAGHEPHVVLTAPTNQTTKIVGNESTISGGGLSCSNGASVVLTRSVFDRNHSNGDGGAVFLEDCDLEIGTDVDFKFDTADGGGGVIAAIQGSRVWTTGPSYAFGQLDGSSHGGFLWADASEVSLTNVLLGGGFSLEVDGGRIHLSGGSHLTMVANTDDCPVTIDDFCSGIVSSSASDRGGSIFVEDSVLILRNTTLEDSSAGVAGSAIHIENGIVELEGVRIVGSSGPSTISVEGDASAELSMRFVTLADSEDASFPILIANQGGGGPSVEILSSILWEPDSPVLFASLNGAAAPDMHCVLASTNVPGSEILVADPLFADPTVSDYRLSVASPAIDYCDDTRAGAEISDLDLEVRGTDQAGVPDRFAGTHFDLGFDEWFGTTAVLHADGFESGDTSTWSQITP